MGTGKYYHAFTQTVISFTKSCFQPEATNKTQNISSILKICGDFQLTDL